MRMTITVIDVNNGNCDMGLNIYRAPYRCHWTGMVHHPPAYLGLGASFYVY